MPTNPRRHLYLACKSIWRSLNSTELYLVRSDLLEAVGGAYRILFLNTIPLEKLTTYRILAKVSSINRLSLTELSTACSLEL